MSDYIQASLEDWSLPGLAVAVVVDDRLVFAEGFGVKQVGRPESIDRETLFQIGSVSKSFGAAAIGALVDDGLVAWDDPLIEHLPWFQLANATVAEQVTLRDLLCHRSGVPEDFYPALGLIDARAVAERARHLTNLGEFRTAYRYSNLGYGLLGLVVEAKSGRSFTDFLASRFFEPLGMASSAATPYLVWADEFVRADLSRHGTGRTGVDR